MTLSRRNILVFHLGALGDFVLTWPLALALGRIHPQSRIIYITHAGKGALAERVLSVESSGIERGWHHLYSDGAGLPAEAARLLASAHSVYSFIAAPEDAWSAQARTLAPDADLCCLRPTPPADYAGHASAYILDQLVDRRAVAEAMRQMIRSINERGVGRRGGASGVIALHPGSGSVQKCWPAENFLRLARKLKDRGQTVRVILGEVELERWPAERIEAFAEVAEICRPASYLELLDALAGAAFYVGNDSGPSHLAGVIGLPALCLFGPTSPVTWRPLGPGVRVIQRMPMETIDVDEIILAMHE
jgi:heptosyltransferase III